MSKRMKEEERIESVIRTLLKLQENRRCINCNSLGPQYVCTTFWTFVCTSCSGVHREFTHRVKSVSMAKFNAEEISALQAGGNERAREIYFKEWDPQRHSFPDGSNQSRLRDFIKHVYVDRKFAGDRSMGKPATMKAGARADYCEWHSIEKPSPKGRVDDRSSKSCIDERRNPRYKPDNVISSGHRSRPVNFEIVDDRFRDDGFGSGRRSESHRPSNAESKAGSRLPVSQTIREKISPPVVRPIGDILGENVPPLQVGESPEANDRKDIEGSALGQNTASSSEPGSVDGKSLELKRVNSGSLIDLSTDPEPPDHAAETQMMEKASDAPNIDSLESILFELSTPVAGYVDIRSTAPGNADALSAAPLALSSSVGAPVTASTANTPAALSTRDAPAASLVGMTPILQSSSCDSIVMQPNQPYSFSSGDRSSTTQHTSPSVGALYNQSWTPSHAQNAQDSSSASAEESSQASSKVAKDNTSGVGLQDLTVEAKSSRRKEIPVDLLASCCTAFSAAVPSWQIHPHLGMGFSMQYHPNAAPVSAFPNSAKSMNPFDLNDDSTQAQVSMFPPMLPLQEGLPNSSAPTASLCTSDTHSFQLMQPQASPYASIASPQLSSYGAFMGQQLLDNVPVSRPQGISSVSGGEAAFASSYPIKQPSSRYPVPTISNSFSSTGVNPFE